MGILLKPLRLTSATTPTRSEPRNSSPQDLALVHALAQFAGDLAAQRLTGAHADLEGLAAIDARDDARGRRQANGQERAAADTVDEPQIYI